MDPFMNSKRTEPLAEPTSIDERHQPLVRPVHSAATHPPGLSCRSANLHGTGDRPHSPSCPEASVQLIGWNQFGKNGFGFSLQEMLMDIFLCQKTNKYSNNLSKSISVRLIG